MRWIFYLIPLHLKPSGIRRKEDDDAEIPWVWNRNSFGRWRFFGEVEAGRGRGLEMGFSRVLMLTPTLFCQSGHVLT